ncbi:prephenate dehydrogenase [Aporhodopirellula aestuarii]|uniref:Prephenate dehydrogenase/arogenate dehydrogenase family protein n=1 Tax=Aporhodopirellula aestuarii TaxID=2950107 RepID=A0ABT0UE92_9BACT|nr:prephenate dehydrogenase/arogenate dehydrogenase family protein [Aporhodopirellula aestuarii]MCM2375209.1 prephenate dehydrogenase/arogenate dehydrogenase family protein [Aporhodopirellula aestuarii]
MNTSAPHTDFSEAPIRTIAVVGLGLLGGSVAKAVRRGNGGESIRVIGCARREETRQFAIENGFVDDVTSDHIEAASQADLVLIATPVDRIADYVIEIASQCPRVLMTDVGSTKFRIVEAVNCVPEAASRFVAAHPIAGSEKTGLQHACGNLFVEKTIVITPSGKEAPGVIDAVTRFWQSTGGRVVQLTPRRHDDLLAVTSHMPHLMSSLVANQLPVEAIPMIGTGWLDTTRIAAGDEGLWTAIVSENRDAILDALEHTAKNLGDLIRSIRSQDDDSLMTFLRDAREKRESAKPTPTLPQ